MNERYRILTFDGGPSAPTYIRVLRQLEQEHPGLLGAADLFAGTSSGAMSALYFAQFSKEERAARGLEIIDDLIGFNDAILGALRPGLRGIVRLGTGVLSMQPGRPFRRLLERTYARSPRFGDLASDVVIVSYRVLPDEDGDDKRGPKIYRYDAREGARGDDAEVPTAEVALRSSALPMLLPVQTEHVDGAIFANNPAMCAVVDYLSEEIWASDEGRLAPEDLVELPFHLVMRSGQRYRPVTAEHAEQRHRLVSDRLARLVVLSMGGDDPAFGSWVTRALLRTGLSAWGWLPWNFAPTYPMLLMQLFLNSGGRGVSYQASQLLGERFLRLALTPADRRLLETFAYSVLGGERRVRRAAEATVHRWLAEARRPPDPGRKPLLPTWEDTRSWVGDQWMPG
ncbi:MAG: patatin-like phospholipase family protein [Myxococcota bacterium]